MSLQTVEVLAWTEQHKSLAYSNGNDVQKM